MKSKITFCDICGEKILPKPIHTHDSIYMCGRCSVYYKLHFGAVIMSLRRFVAGNVL
jgi:ribosomal protein S27AE